MMTTHVKTASTCPPPETVQGTHVFDILGYSKHRGMGADYFIRSGVFSIAGHQWVIFFYPDGYGEEVGGFDFVSAYLHLLSTAGKVRASCDLRLVNPSTGVSTSVHPTLVIMRELDPEKDKVCHCMCISRGELEGTYVKNDRLTMECVVTVRKEPRVSKSRTFPASGCRCPTSSGSSPTCWRAGTVPTSRSASLARRSRRTGSCSPCARRCSRRSSAAP